MAAMAALSLLAGPAVAMEPLRILTWPGYADQDLVREFERRHKVRVEVTFVGTDDALWEKLTGNGGGHFDVLAANTAELTRFIDNGFVAPLDLANIPNTRHQLPRFRDLASIPGIHRGGRVYAVPYTYAEMGLIYNRRLVSEAPKSMGALWDPRYRGRVLAYDGSTHNFSLAALLLGLRNPFHMEERDFGRAVDKLIELRHNVLTFYTLPEEAVELFRENQVALVFANFGDQQVKQLRNAGADIGYVIPREGALAWLDCWAVAKGTPNKKLAEAWIDFTLERPVSRALTQRQGLANTIDPSASGVAADSRIVWLEPVEDPVRRAALWNRIVSGDRPGKF